MPETPTNPQTVDAMAAALAVIVDEWLESQVQTWEAACEALDAPGDPAGDAVIEALLQLGNCPATPGCYSLDDVFAEMRRRLVSKP